jgi:hypothetical protein
MSHRADRQGRLVALALAVVAAAASCSPAGSIEIGRGVPNGSDAGDGAAGAPANDAAIDAHLPDAEPPPPPQCFPCSADLHSVIDCPSGNVVETCPPDEGCANGHCVPACDSAAANKSSFGCDFYSVQPEGSSTWWGCLTAFVVNTWNAPVTIGVSRAGQTFDSSQFVRKPSGSGQSITYAPLPNGLLDPGEIAMVFLTDSTFALRCPAEANVVAPLVVQGSQPPVLAGTKAGEAFHITTSAPVSAYDIYSADVTSATLLLPVSAWNTNYVAVSPFTPSPITGRPPAVQLVASQDDTHVTIEPPVAIAGGNGVAFAPKGQPTTYTMHAGEILELALTGQTLDGMPIESHQPIGMWASQSCFNVPDDVAYCDSAHQQIPPVAALGSEYVAVRYRNRIDGGPEETPPWRLTGLVDGTTLAWEPSTPAGAPTKLAAGQVAVFDAAGPFVVRSQDDKHPFYIAAYMTGCGEVGDVNGGPPGCPGDPEFVNIVPPRQWLSHYLFFTDPSYPETNLVVVRKAGAPDVTLDCEGTLGGWLPIGTTGYEYTRTDLVRGNFERQGQCDNGRHEMRSDAPFALTVWGWGSLATGTGDPDAGVNTQSVSYAYPAGMSLQTINSVQIHPH